MTILCTQCGQDITEELKDFYPTIQDLWEVICHDCAIKNSTEEKKK